jgi:hypothetical protein
VLAIGGFLVCIALLTLAAVAPIFRSSNPPWWATRGWVGEIVTVAIVCTLAVGLGYFGAGTIDAFQRGPDFLDLGVLAGVVLVTVVIWRWLSGRARPGALEAATELRGTVPDSPDASGGQVALAERATVSASQPQPPNRAA